MCSSGRLATVPSCLASNSSWKRVVCVYSTSTHTDGQIQFRWRRKLVPAILTGETGGHKHMRDRERGVPGQPLCAAQDVSFLLQTMTRDLRKHHHRRCTDAALQNTTSIAAFSKLKLYYSTPSANKMKNFH